MKQNSETNAIEICNLNKSFRNSIILKDINLQIKKNETFGLIGLNGSGKTTIIKSILQLINNYSGDINILGKKNTLYKSRQNIAYLPEKFSPPKNLTGKEFIKFVVSIYNIKYIESEVYEHCDDLHFSKKTLDQKICNYSKGMTQKISLISTFITNSDIYILDEPMSGLDPLARLLLKEKIIKLGKQGKTVFFSSHILTDIQSLCNRIAILNNKEISFQGDCDLFIKQHSKKDTDDLENAFLHLINYKNN